LPFGPDVEVVDGDVETRLAGDDQLRKVDLVEFDGRQTCRVGDIGGETVVEPVIDGLFGVAVIGEAARYSVKKARSI
jgi:hypothetical protein